MSERQLAVDSAGFPILLETVIPVRSGNPNRQDAGRFGRGPVEEAVKTRGTAGVTGEEIARRMDAVREAAREFEQWSPQDATEWLRGRITRPFTQAEVNQFLADVRSQQLTDLVDAIDQAERGNKRGRRHVRVVAPRGYRRKALGALEDNELKMLVGRLRARGWTDVQVGTLVKRLPENRRPQLGEIVEVSWPVEDNERDAALGMVETVARSLPTPEIKLEPRVHVDRGAVRRTPHRDEDGVILYVDEEPI